MIKLPFMNSVKSPPGRGTPTDKDVEALLARHHCPTPLHALRTRLLGAIASPPASQPPIAVVQAGSQEDGLISW